MPPKKGVKSAAAPKNTKNAPTKVGKNQSARELRSLLSCYGFAFAADSTSLVAFGPQNRLTPVSAPPHSTAKKTCSATFRSKKLLLTC